MIQQGEALKAGQELRTTVCIVGAGAAGITAAIHLARAGIEVVLLEAGTQEADDDIQDAYVGEIGGEYLERPGAKYLTRSRLRQWGGTTNHWAGWTMPLSDIDFEKRDWVPNSGWPIKRSDLDSYYPKAAKIVEVRPWDYSVKEMESEGLYEHPFAKECGFDHVFFHYSPKTNFGEVFYDELMKSPKISAFMGAPVMGLECHAGGQAVRRVRVKNFAGDEAYVYAKVFIVAAGGIDNARILLASDDVHKNGLGNHNDQLGRYFMEHSARRRAMQGIFNLDPKEIELYWKRTREFAEHRVHTVLRFGEATQRKYQLLNSGISMFHPKKKDKYEVDVAVQDTLSSWWQLKDGAPRYLLRLTCEHSPNPLNRVTLVKDRDAHGMRRVKLTLDWSEVDRKSVDKTIEIFARRLGASGYGRIRQRGMGFYHYGCHHMGTTRMSDSPKAGVVDKNAKLHGIDNCYVGGSSIFSTSGFANPTLTIVALTLRLVDHLKVRLS